MTKKRNAQRVPRKPAPGADRSQHASAPPPRRGLPWLIGGIVVLAAAAVWFANRPVKAPPAQPIAQSAKRAAARYVGSATCRECQCYHRRLAHKRTLATSRVKLDRSMYMATQQPALRATHVGPIEYERGRDRILSGGYPARPNGPRDQERKAFRIQ